MTSTHVDAAFRSSRKDQAYVFVEKRYVLVDYAPCSTGDNVLNGPVSISVGFPSLMGTPFAEYGIDCAFGSCDDKGQAYIFCGKICALFNYAPAGNKDDKIISGPMTIAEMFPFLKGTVFQNGVDAAFESTTDYEAYLFKGNKSARINYSGIGAVTTCSIVEVFPSLAGTSFANGVDAAFASHRLNEAYLFKADSYARINFAPDTSDDPIPGGVRQIRPNWPSLRGILHL